MWHWVQDLKEGLSSYTLVPKLIGHPRVRPVILLSIICCLIAYLLSSLITLWILTLLGNLLLQIDWIRSIYEWIEQYTLLRILSKITIGFSSLIIALSFFKSVYLIMASPLLAWMSERIAEIIQNKDYPFSWIQFLKDIKRGILLTLRNTIWQIGLTLPLYLLALIPLIGLGFGFLIVLIDSYYLGFSLLDYSFERHLISIRESRIMVKSRRGIAIGLGLVLYVGQFVPLIGVVLITTAGVIASTGLYYKHFNQVTNE